MYKSEKERKYNIFVKGKKRLVFNMFSICAHESYNDGLHRISGQQNSEYKYRIPPHSNTPDSETMRERTNYGHVLRDI